MSVVFVAGCGDEGSTTVIQTAPGSEAQTTTVTESTVTVKESDGGSGQSATGGNQDSAPDSGSSEPSGDPPDVVGLTLPAAEQALKSEGWKPDVSNTDTTFGIIVKENYTVCKEDDPVGNVVPILAQKYGC